MDLKDIRNKYIKEGYDFLDASSKTCQDVILYKLAKSSLSKNITIKGGVVMHNISNDNRRATRDFDLDFIKYSIDDKAIKHFIDKLNDVKDGITMKIVAPIVSLNHQEYDGKRVELEVKDANKHRIETKLDIGVHKNFEIEQEEYCFDLTNIGESVSLLINSKEQIFTEKLKSLLKLGAISTRYKDIFDIYYLINIAGLNKDKLINCFDEFIFNQENMREKNVEEIYNRLNYVFQNNKFIVKVEKAYDNWLEIQMDEVVDVVLNFFKGLERVEI